MERIRKEGDRRVALISLTDAGARLSKTLPDPIEKRFIAELADLEPEQVQILATAMNQVLDLIDTRGVAAAPLELNPRSNIGSVDTH